MTQEQAEEHYLERMKDQAVGRRPLPSQPLVTEHPGPTLHPAEAFPPNAKRQTAFIVEGSLAMARMGKEGMMNRAAGDVHKAGGDARPGPASRGGAKTKSDVGNETKADMKGAQLGNPTDKNPLRGAMAELHSQHPERHDDLGPHHGGTAHLRHRPMGLK